MLAKTKEMNLVQKAKGISINTEAMNGTENKGTFRDIKIRGGTTEGITGGKTTGEDLAEAGRGGSTAKGSTRDGAEETVATTTSLGTKGDAANTTKLVNLNPTRTLKWG